MSEGVSIERIMNERREKGRELMALGKNPYGNGFVPSMTIAQFTEKFLPFSKEELEGVKDQCHLAGRIMAVRNMGKAAFLRIKDRSGEVQLFLQQSALSDVDFQAFRLSDVGDVVGVSGTPMKTKTGELSLNLSSFTILTKSLRPLPDKWHGLSNIEQRHRQRYVDLIVNDKARWVFLTRSKIIRGIQRFLDERGFVEVETPILMDVAGGAEARPFMTHHNALGEDLSLRIATELHLKRLVIGGIERVYEIGRLFRNEGVSTRHNPEFTTIEFYQAFATYLDFMDLTEELFRHLVFLVHGQYQVTYQEQEIDFAKPFRRVPIAKLVAEHLGFDDKKTQSAMNIESVEDAIKIALGHIAHETLISICLLELTLEEMRQFLPFCKIDLGENDLEKLSGRLSKELSLEQKVQIGRAIDQGFVAHKDRRRRLALHILYGVFDHEVEETIVQPTFITDFSVSVSPLARKRDGDGAVVDRFELIVAKMELANSFNELTDADDQRERFLKQVQQKAFGNHEAPDLDEDFLHALEVGMPPAAGEGIGIDRLAMILTDSPSIREVILFPKMRKK
ncbi:MAG TPA: lysine--tRNA ligase [Myxococcota bacterium]|nr:lysine--tRNA ligase [Myxococcota bacterium]